MSPMLRSLRQRGRRPLKNVSGRSVRGRRSKKQTPASSSGKKSTLTDVSSPPSPPSPPSLSLAPKDSRAHPLTRRKATAENANPPPKKRKISSDSNRMTTRSSATDTPSFLASPDYSSSSSLIPKSIRSLRPTRARKRRSKVSDPAAITELPSKDAKLHESEQRSLRPREALRRNLSAPLVGRRPFVDVKLLGRDGGSILGRRIKVWWPLDSCWYSGTVKKYDSVRHSYWIVYDDGDEEWLDLKTERCRVQAGQGEVVNPPRPRKRSYRQSLEKAEEVRSNSQNDEADAVQPGRIEGAMGDSPMRSNSQNDEADAVQPGRIEGATGDSAMRSNSQNDEADAVQSGGIEGAAGDSATFALSESTNQWKVSSEGASDMDLYSIGNCSSIFQTPPKVTHVYTRRQSSRNPQPPCGNSIFVQKPTCGDSFPERDSIDLSVVQNETTVPAATACNLFEGGSESDILLAESGGFCQQHLKSDDAHEKEAKFLLAANETTPLVLSSLVYRNFSGFEEESPNPHPPGLCPATAESDANQATVNTSIFSDCFKHLPANQTEVQHSRGSDWIMPLPNSQRLEQTCTSTSLLIGCATRAGDTLIEVPYNRQNDFFSERFGDNQTSSGLLSPSVRESSETPARRFGYEQFFLHSIYVTLSQIFHGVFGRELSLQETDLFDGLFKRLFLNGSREQVSIIKQSKHSQRTDWRFCDDAGISLPVKLQSPDFPSNSGLKESDRLDGVSNCCQTQLFESDPRDSSDEEDWNLALKRGRSHLVTQSNSSDRFMTIFSCNGLNFIVAVSRKDNTVQVECNGLIRGMPLVLKLVSGSSACLANISNYLHRLFDTKRISNRAVPNLHLRASRESRLTSPKSAVAGSRNGVCRANMFSMKSRARGLITMKKEVYYQSQETLPSMFKVSEPLMPLLGKIWPCLSGKDGFYLGISQILYIFLAQNGFFAPGLSSPTLQSRRLLKYFRRKQSENNSGWIHGRKRRRSRKPLKCLIPPLAKDMVGKIKGADSFTVRQVSNRHRKRRRRLTGPLLAWGIGSDTSPSGEKSYNALRISEPLQWSNENELHDVDGSGFFEERNSNDFERISARMESGSLKLMLNQRESSISCHFRRSEHDSDTNFPKSSLPNASFLCYNDREKVIRMNDRRRRRDCRTDLGALDKSRQGCRKRQKRYGSSTMQNRLDFRVPFGRNCSFSEPHTGNKGTEMPENIQFQDSEPLPLNCSANLLFVQNDRGWRELGATVELLNDDNTWVLSISHCGECLLKQKAEQSIAFGTSNKYTHAMMWKGGKDWSLEFEDRREWLIFKEMHQLCFYRNTKVVLARQIPIPGVCYVQNLTAEFERPFVRSEQYLCRKQGEIDAALSCSRALYDLDSEDENWLDQMNKEFATTKAGHSLIFNEDRFEALIDKLEKAAYLSNQSAVDMDKALELCQGIAPTDMIKSVHSYWITKRSKKGLPLIRYFQPVPWEQYQRQLCTWEAEVARIKKSSHLSHHSLSAALPPRPEGFAFCLRPRGLAAPNKVQKQRSQKKLGSNGAMPRHWASAIPLDLSVCDEGPVDLQHKDQPSLGAKTANYQSYHDGPYIEAELDPGSSQPVAGGKGRWHYGSNFSAEKNFSIKNSLLLARRSSASRKQRRNSRKAKKRRLLAMDEEFIPQGKGKPSKILQRLHNVSLSKEVPFQSTSLLSPVADVMLPRKFHLKAGNANPVVLDLDSNSTILPASDFNALAVAKAAVARKAADVAARKREHAQALYTVADAALHKAVSAMMAAEAAAADIALNFPDRPLQPVLHPDMQAYTAEPIISRSNDSIQSKHMLKHRGRHSSAELLMPWQHCGEITGDSFGNIARDSSVDINTDDALLPIPSWTQELGAGIGSKLIYRGEASPPSSRRHSAVLGTMSDRSSLCSEGVA